jgi:hypothetical protein
MQELITSMADNAMDWYTQLSDIQVVSSPLIEKLNITDLKTPQVTTINVETTIQLSKDLQGQFNKPEQQYKEFIVEVKSIVSSTAMVIS